MRYLAFILIITGLYSCNPQRYLAKHFPPTIHDSIVIERITTIHDTVAIIEADSASIKARLECDSSGNVLIAELAELQGRKAKVRFIYKDNYIQVDCQTNEDSLYLVWESEFNSVRQNKKEVQHIVKYKVPVIFWIIGGALLVCFFIFGYKIRGVL